MRNAVTAISSVCVRHAGQIPLNSEQRLVRRAVQTRGVDGSLPGRPSSLFRCASQGKQSEQQLVALLSEVVDRLIARFRQDALDDLLF
jgi:hypothetical protein